MKKLFFTAFIAVSAITVNAQNHKTDSIASPGAFRADSVIRGNELYIDGNKNHKQDTISNKKTKPKSKPSETPKTKEARPAGKPQ